MLLTLENISQIFSSKVALDNITLNFEDGKIHAITGENGAGKSTLASILCGDRQPVSGSILLDGKKTILKNPADAVAKGIILVHQRPLLAESITVKENIFLGSESTKTSTRFLKARLIQYAKQWAPLLNMNALVKDIGSDMRFYTALLGALCKNPKILILDEPSVFLNNQQRIELYTNLHQFTSGGNTVIVITHSMTEAQNYADSVICLRKGNLLARYDNPKLFKKGSPGYFDFDESFFSEKPNEKSVNDSNSKSISVSQESFLSFHNVTLKPLNRPALFNISFSAKSGEITLVRGFSESGLETLENLITGMEETYCSGTVTLSCPKDFFQARAFTLNLSKKHLTAALLRGNNYSTTGIIPSNRVFRSSNPALTVEQMLCVYYNGKNKKEYAQNLINKAEVAIKPEEKASALSGGMLQRLILARELEQNPQFLILCEPLQGLDSTAAAAMCRRIAELASENKTVIVLSTTDFPENICAKIYRLMDGELKNDR